MIDRSEALSWTRVPLAEVAEVLMGQSPPGSTYNADGRGLPFYQGKADFGSLYPEPRKWCTAPTKVAEPGDILISVRAPVGPTNLCRERSAIGRGLAAVRPYVGISSKYLLYAFRGTAESLRSKATGTTFEAVSGSQVRAHPIPLAPADHRDRIVEAIELHLSRADAAGASVRRAIRNIERYRDGLLHQAVSGRLTRGSGWRSVSLGEVLVSLRNGLSQKPDGSVGTRILRISAVRSMRVNLSDVRYLNPQIAVEGSLLRENDLLFTRYNGNPELVGACGRVRGLVEPTAHPDKLIRGVVNERLAVPAFIELAANAGITRQHVRSRTKTTAGQAGIAGSDLKSAPLLLPSLEEQEEVIAIVEAKLSEADNLAQMLVELTKRESSLRRRILEDAFTEGGLGNVV